MIDRYIYFYNQKRIQLKTGEPAACATLLLLKLNISYQGSFLYCPHKIGQCNGMRGVCVYLKIFFSNVSVGLKILNGIGERYHGRNF